MFDDTDLGDLIDQYESSPGRILREFVNDSRYLLQIHDANFNDVKLLIDEYELLTATNPRRPETVFVDIGRIASQEYLAKFLRFIHNYCASLYTIEQQYTEFLTLGRYKEASYNDSVGEVFKELIINPKYLFFFAIRNYFTHMRIPSFKTGVLHSRQEEGVNDTIFITRGRFTVPRSFFSVDTDRALWGDTSGYKSRLITNQKRLKILDSFIRETTQYHVDIEIKDILYAFHTELHEHLEKINKSLIDDNEDEYNRSTYLIEEIRIRQDALRST